MFVHKHPKILVTAVKYDTRLRLTIASPAVLRKWVLTTLQWMAAYEVLFTTEYALIFRQSKVQRISVI